MSELKQQLETELEVLLLPRPLKTRVPSVPLTLALFCCAQNEKTLAKACEKARTEKRKLQEALARSEEEVSKLRGRLAEAEAELQAAKDE